MGPRKPTGHHRAGRHDRRKANRATAASGGGGPPATRARPRVHAGEPRSREKPPHTPPAEDRGHAGTSNAQPYGRAAPPREGAEKLRRHHRRRRERPQARAAQLQQRGHTSARTEASGGSSPAPPPHGVRAEQPPARSYQPIPPDRGSQRGGGISQPWSCRVPWCPRRRRRGCSGRCRVAVLAPARQGSWLVGVMLGEAK